MDEQFRAHVETLKTSIYKLTGAQYNLIPQTISVQLELLTAPVSQQGTDDSALFISKLKALDQMHESKSMSDEEFEKARLDLIKRYMPEAIAQSSEHKVGQVVHPNESAAAE